MEIELEITYYDSEPYLRIGVYSDEDGGSASISLKELKKALEPPLLQAQQPPNRNHPLR